MAGSAHRTETVEVHGYAVPTLVGGAGPPLVFLHGAGAAGRWLEIHDRLAEAFTVYAPAHPGFAETPLPKWVRGVDDVAFHYIDFMLTLGPQKPVVAGLSIGGWIAMELATMRPELLGGLVLLDALGLRPDRPMPDLFIMELQEAMNVLFADPSNAFKLMPGEFGIDTIVQNYAEQGAVARLAWKRPYNPHLERRLHLISTPTLVVWGAEDALLPPSHGETLAAAIPGARFQNIPGAGHVVIAEAPEAVANAIVEFVREC